MLFDQQITRLLILILSTNDRFMFVKHSLSILLLIFTHAYTFSHHKASVLGESSSGEKA